MDFIFTFIRNLSIYFQLYYTFIIWGIINCQAMPQLQLKQYGPELTIWMKRSIHGWFVFKNHGVRLIRSGLNEAKFTVEKVQEKKKKRKNMILRLTLANRAKLARA